LWKFIIGRFHHPREIERYFCFIDLNQSTTIAEKLGNIKFGSLLKDFYSDITDAIRYAKAEVYQYVGDEIVLSWPVSSKTNIEKVLGSVFLMKRIINNKADTYLKLYGYLPEFKAGLHGGKVLVTWVGEVKKEILYIGDVLNTTSRIRGECKQFSSDFLISHFVKDKAQNTSFKIDFVEELILRGKEEKVEIYKVTDL